MNTYQKPLPHIVPANEPFWKAAHEGRLVAQRCNDCEKLRLPASPVCDACLSERSEWTELGGQGTVWSVCEFHRAYFASFADELPYNVALVKLDEGPRLYTNLIGVPSSQITIGHRVIVAFDQVTETISLVKFRLIPVSGADISSS